MRNIFLLFLLSISFYSCHSIKNVPYLQNADEVDLSQSEYQYDLIIQPGDKLNILVFSPDAEATNPFNPMDAIPLTQNSRIENNRRTVHVYLVDTNGNIEFPVIGSVHIAGLTIEQVNHTIKEKIKPYFNSNTYYHVNTYIKNFYVSVLGEVQRPNSFDVQQNKMNVLEALALAGDLTIYGRRENVKLLRQLPNGEYEIHKIDLTDANLLNSPYYYLQQRDVLYVEPNEAMAQNAKIGQTTQLWVRGASIVISMGSLLYRVLSN